MTDRLDIFYRVNTFDIIYILFSFDMLESLETFNMSDMMTGTDLSLFRSFWDLQGVPETMIQPPSFVMISWKLTVTTAIFPSYRSLTCPTSASHAHQVSHAYTFVHVVHSGPAAAEHKVIFVCFLT